MFCSDLWLASLRRPRPAEPDGAAPPVPKNVSPPVVHSNSQSSFMIRGPVGVESSKRILGIDPGLHVAGYGLVEIGSRGIVLREAGVIRTGSHRSLAQRLDEIYRGLREILDAWHPAVMALEELYSHYQRPRTAILMGHARGVICLAAAQAGMPVVSYAATQIKRILTGSGRAPKAQVQRAIQRELGLAHVPHPPDVADALAAALCHYYLKEKPAAMPAPRARG